MKFGVAILLCLTLTRTFGDESKVSIKLQLCIVSVYQQYLSHGYQIGCRGACSPDGNDMKCQSMGYTFETSSATILYLFVVFHQWAISLCWKTASCLANQDTHWEVNRSSWYEYSFKHLKPNHFNERIGVYCARYITVREVIAKWLSF